MRPAKEASGEMPLQDQAQDLARGRSASGGFPYIDTPTRVPPDTRNLLLTPDLYLRRGHLPLRVGPGFGA